MVSRLSCLSVSIPLFSKEDTKEIQLKSLKCWPLIHKYCKVMCHISSELTNGGGGEGQEQGRFVYILLSKHEELS